MPGKPEMPGKPGLGSDMFKDLLGNKLKEEIKKK
jgi:hypothetical protein